MATSSIRQPRIKGLTEVAQKEYPNQQQRKKAIQRSIIRHYVTHNYTIDGRYMDITQVCDMIGMNEIELLGITNRYLEVTGNTLQKVNQEKLARVLISRAIFGVQGAAHASLEQLSILASSQNGEYRPFISGEVNRAIKNVLDSQKMVLEMAQSLMPKTPTISILNQNNQATVNHAYLGPDEAQKLIEAKTEQMGIKPGSEAHLQLLSGTSYQGQSLPGIIATSQDEEAFIAHTLKKRALEETGDLDTQQEREFRDFRIDTGDGDIEII